MRRFLVECKYELVVELHDDADPEFVIEDNACPDTGPVGQALNELAEEHEEHRTCWACAAKGKNRIICELPAT